jgi:hypothetical protein
MEKEPTLEIDKFGNEEWLLNGKLHRVDGPAMEWADGTKRWYQYGKRHRVDGPAVEVHGTKLWYLDSRLYSFKWWKEEVRKYYDTEEDYLLMLLKLD